MRFVPFTRLWYFYKKLKLFSCFTIEQYILNFILLIRYLIQCLNKCNQEAAPKWKSAQFGSKSNMRNCQRLHKTSQLIGFTASRHGTWVCWLTSFDKTLYTHQWTQIRFISLSVPLRFSYNYFLYHWKFLPPNAPKTERLQERLWLFHVGYRKNCVSEWRSCSYILNNCVTRYIVGIMS